MANRITTGSVLIAGGARLPELMHFDSEPYVLGWRLVKNLDSKDLDQIIINAGWNLFYIAGAIETKVFGSDENNTTRKAIMRVIEKLNPKNFNCLEINQTAAKRSLGLPYVAISAHWRHIQKGQTLYANRELRDENPQLQQ